MIVLVYVSRRFVRIYCTEIRQMVTSESLIEFERKCRKQDEDDAKKAELMAPCPMMSELNKGKKCNESCSRQRVSRGT